MSDGQDPTDEVVRSVTALAPHVLRVMRAANVALNSGQLRRNDSTLDAAEKLRDFMRDDPRIGGAARRLSGSQQMQLFATQERAARTGAPAGRGADPGLQAVHKFTQEGQRRPGAASTGPSAGAGERPRTPGQTSTGPNRDRGRGGRGQ